ncbi:hypothetical protein ACMGDK_19655 [Chryseobacterium sp. DT-3]|uniref:hypothetical protein n=1 Tax=Chryseobacterium sp. DT-3 TaxID=3396164 RepID=UPI003F1B469E
MKKIFLLMCSLGLSAMYLAQIGINTATPTATLDVVGKPTIATTVDGILPPRITGDQLQAKDAIYTTSQNGVIVYATAAVTTPSPKTINVTAPGFYYYDAPNSSWLSLRGSGQAGGTGTALYASRDGAWSLANLGIAGTNWNKISLTSTDTKSGVASLINNGVYTAPKPGLYEVKYDVQLEGGVDLNVLGGKSLGIIKNGATIIDRKIFDAVRVSLLNVTLAAVPVTSTTLTTVVQLNTGDTLTFAVETGGVNLGLLTDGKVSVNVYKISE